MPVPRRYSNIPFRNKPFFLKRGMDGKGYRRAGRASVTAHGDRLSAALHAELPSLGSPEEICGARRTGILAAEEKASYREGCAIEDGRCFFLEVPKE